MMASEIAYMTLDELLAGIEDDARDHGLTTGDGALRDIIRCRLMKPFRSNVDQWDQGYDIGRTTGVAEGHESACAKFEHALDIIRSTVEQFSVGAPWSVQRRSEYSYDVVSANGDYTVATCEYESDADALVRVLNATLVAGKAAV